jgi:hypothetical protein
MHARSVDYVSKVGTQRQANRELAKLPRQRAVHQLPSDWGIVHQFHQQHIPVYFHIILSITFYSIVFSRKVFYPQKRLLYP